MNDSSKLLQASSGKAVLQKIPRFAKNGDFLF